MTTPYNKKHQQNSFRDWKTSNNDCKTTTNKTST